jgi:hypothetical protein
MPGGLLQLISTGESNRILNGNPSKTFFKSVYKKCTTFGLQRFKLNYSGNKKLSYFATSNFEFKITRYADMLWDSYIVMNLPNIWSSSRRTSTSRDLQHTYHEKITYSMAELRNIGVGNNNSDHNPYEFQWIKNIGFNIINQITISAGGTILQQYSGEYMQNVVERDEGTKRSLINDMIGNTVELTNPAKYYNNWNVFKNDYNYPTINKTNTNTNILPSIKGRKLYIPLMAWFCHSPATALPLIALQYQEIRINIEFKPICELYTILNDTSISRPCVRDEPWNDETHPLDQVGAKHLRNYNYKRVSPSYKYNCEGDKTYFEYKSTGIPSHPSTHLISQFLYPDKTLDLTQHRNDWDEDIHIIGTFIFLSKEERRQIAENDYELLIKTPNEWDTNNVVGTRSILVPSNNVVSNYMFRFRRNDSHYRNEWSNYQNWEYEDIIPIRKDFWENNQLTYYNRDYHKTMSVTDPELKRYITAYGDDDGHLSDLQRKNMIAVYNELDTSYTKIQKNILLNMSIVCGADNRENILESGLYNYIEKLSRSTGTAKSGLYSYNFCINTNLKHSQPTGGQNTTQWKHVIFNVNTHLPPLNRNGPTLEVCKDDRGQIVGVRKNDNDLYEYYYDLRIFEETYNMVIIRSGLIGLLLSK